MSDPTTTGDWANCLTQWSELTMPEARVQSLPEKARPRSEALSCAFLGSNIVFLSPVRVLWLDCLAHAWHSFKTEYITMVDATGVLRSVLVQGLLEEPPGL